MEAQTFLDNFGNIVEAPGGVDRLRELILNLAVRGLLVGQHPEHHAVRVTWSANELRLRPEKLWSAPALDAPLPNGWAAVPMAKLGTWGSGGTPTKSRADYYGGPIPWLVIGDLNDGIVTTCKSTITELGLAESSARLIPTGAVLIAMYGSIGKAAITGIGCASNQAIAHCIPDEELISTEFLFLMARSLQPRLFSLGKGAAQQNISQTVLKHLQVGVPPVVEQERIVAKVHELMQRCDDFEARQQALHHVSTRLRASSLDALTTAETDNDLHTAWSRIQANWEALTDDPDDVTALRQTVLQLAVTGRLHRSPITTRATPTSEDEHVNREEATPQGAYQLPGLPVGWTWVRLGDLIDGIEAGKSPTAQPWPAGPEEWGVLKVSACSWGRFKPDENKSLFPGTEINENNQVRAGDLLISRANTQQLVARSVIVEQTPPNLLISDKTLRLRVKDCCLPEFLNLANLSEVARTHYESNASGTSDSMRNVSQAVIRNTPIPLPPLEEQREVVEAYSRLTSQCDELASALVRRSGRAEAVAVRLSR